MKTYFTFLAEKIITLWKTDRDLFLFLSWVFSVLVPFAAFVTGALLSIATGNYFSYFDTTFSFAVVTMILLVIPPIIVGLYFLVKSQIREYREWKMSSVQSHQSDQK